MSKKNTIEQAAEIIIQSKLTLALTGAGVSVESGIPDFRSPGGLWSIYDPNEYATISAFNANPEKVWTMQREIEKLLHQASPNRCHLGMAALEEMGCLHHVVTQNVDSLHQAAGSRSVIEYHGNSSKLKCMACGKSYQSNDKKNEIPPRCTCGRILKPDVVFFGEPIPKDAMYLSFSLATQAEALVIVGTSALVSPANTLPATAKQHNAKIIEINLERTHLTETVTDVYLHGDASTIMTELVQAVKKKKQV